MKPTKRNSQMQRLRHSKRRHSALKSEGIWRHADGSVRDDHMDSRPGDKFVVEELKPDYESMTKTELQKLAAEKKIKGRSLMSKSRLIEALQRD